MYDSPNICLKFEYDFSDFNSNNSNKGLMQGEAPSPLLFSLYINDFEKELINGFSEPLYIHHVSLFVLMYADDTEVGL